MDLTSLMGALLGSASTSGISKATGTSSSAVTDVLTNALPYLLKGANQQAASAETADSFAQALEYHAADDTSDINSFMGNVDLNDGAKIIQHLLGGNTTSTTKAIAQSSGVSQKNTASILSAAAPLLLSLLGQQTGAQTKAASTRNAKTDLTTALIGTLLSNVDLGSLIGSLVSTDTSAKTTKKTTTTTKKTTSTTKKVTSAAPKTTTKKSSGVDLSDGLDVGDVVGILGKLLK